MEYHIKKADYAKNIEWDTIPEAEIGISGWEEYCIQADSVKSARILPRTIAKAVFAEKEKSLIVRLYCFEIAPKTDISEPDGEIYKDSCVEFFCNFLPQSEVGFINFELNSRGVLHCAVGSGRSGRRFVRKIFAENGDKTAMPKINVLSGNGFWGVEIIITEAFLRAVYSDSIQTHGNSPSNSAPQKETKLPELKSGSEFRANFYKSGECCIPVHFLMWSKVNTETPDFHCPEYFGKLIID